MAAEVGVLAEALVKVKLVSDNTSIKNQVKAQTDDYAKHLKAQGTLLRSTARSYFAIANIFNKAANAMLKAIVLPASALGGLGIKKYLKTTDEGAGKLRKTFHALNSSWNQFLARVGKAIYSSGTLTRVLEKIAKILDSLTEKQILGGLKIAAFIAILAVVAKISYYIYSWRGFIARAMGAMIQLGTKMGEIIAGGTAGSAAAKVTATSGAAGAAGAAGAVAIPAAGGGSFWQAFKYLDNLKRLKEIEVLTKKIAKSEKLVEYIKKASQKATMEKIKLTGIANTPSFKKLLYDEVKRAVKSYPIPQEKAKQLGYRGPKEVPSFIDIERSLKGQNKFQATKVAELTAEVIKFQNAWMKIWKAITGTLKFLGKVTTVLTIILAIFDAWRGLLRGLGVKAEMLKDSSSFLIGVLKKAWQGITFVFSYIGAFFTLIGNITTLIFEGFGAWIKQFVSIFMTIIKTYYNYIKNLYTKGIINVFDIVGSLKSGVESARKQLWDGIKEAFANFKKNFPYIGQPKEAKKENEKFDFIPKKTYTTSFAGLNKAAQEMADESGLLSATKELVVATKESIVATKQNTEAMKGDMRIHPPVDVTVTPNMVGTVQKNTYNSGGNTSGANTVNNVSYSIGNKSTPTPTVFTNSPIPIEPSGVNKNKVSMATM